MSGPMPEPTRKKRLKGNPGKRKLRKNEPTPVVGAPEPPDWLCEVAREEWFRLCGELLALGMLHRMDRALITAYCETWAEYCEAVQRVRDEGHVVISEKGGAYQHPWVGIKNQAAERLIRLAGHFGLSPAARTRISTPGKAPEADPLEELMNRKRNEVG